MKSPKVSIVIPVYNGEEYVKEAIDSALNQTYKNIEIIVVNDGSKDNTEKICKSYGNKIKYLSKENGGVSTALNLAIKNMSGEYFSWLSHDDRYYKEKIEEEIKYVGKKKLVISDYDLMDKDSKVYNRVILSHNKIVKHQELALLNGMVNGITMLIPKEAFDECGLFDEKQRCTQDYDLWFKMLLKGYEFVHVEKVLATTRIHNLQTGNTSPKMLSEGNILWERMILSLPKKTKEKISGSEYSFYVEIADFLKETPYTEAMEKIKEEAKTIKIGVDVSNIKVSVIMPFYDEEMDVLKRSYNSIVKQTHKNLEIILVNDNPTKYDDNKLKKLFNDDRTKYLKNSKNIGVADSRNRALKEVTGEYFCFLDADDEFLEDKIKIQLEEMVCSKALFSHTSYTRITDEETYINSGVQKGDMIPLAISLCRIATPTVMIETKFFKDNNFSFNKDLKYGEDTCLWLQLLCKARLLGIDNPLVNVYANEESAAYNEKKQIEGLKNIIAFVTSNKDLNMYDTQIAELCSGYIGFVLKPSDDYNNELNEIINSKSWKITKPLRFVSRKVSSLKRRISKK